MKKIMFQSSPTKEPETPTIEPDVKPGNPDVKPGKGNDPFSVPTPLVQPTPKAFFVL